MLSAPTPDESASVLSESASVSGRALNFCGSILFCEYRSHNTRIAGFSQTSQHKTAPRAYTLGRAARKLLAVRRVRPHGRQGCPSPASVPGGVFLCQRRRPFVERPPPLFKEIAAQVRGLGFGADLVRQTALSNISGDSCAGRPISER